MVFQNFFCFLLLWCIVPGLSAFAAKKKCHLSDNELTQLINKCGKGYDALDKSKVQLHSNDCTPKPACLMGTGKKNADLGANKLLKVAGDADNLKNKFKDDLEKKLQAKKCSETEAQEILTRTIKSKYKTNTGNDINSFRACFAAYDEIIEGNQRAAQSLVQGGDKLSKRKTDLQSGQQPGDPGAGDQKGEKNGGQGGAPSGGKPQQGGEQGGAPGGEKPQGGGEGGGKGGGEGGGGDKPQQGGEQPKPQQDPYGGGPPACPDGQPRDANGQCPRGPDANGCNQDRGEVFDTRTQQCVNASTVNEPSCPLNDEFPMKQQDGSYRCVKCAKDESGACISGGGQAGIDVQERGSAKKIIDEPNEATTNSRLKINVNPLLSPKP